MQKFKFYVIKNKMQVIIKTFISFPVSPVLASNEIFSKYYENCALHFAFIK